MREKEDWPPLLAAGLHVMDIGQLRAVGVEPFTLSETRSAIFEGFLTIFGQLESLGIPAELVVDGSFLTEEISPDDIDFAVVVTPEYYENCWGEQETFLNWLRDDKTIKQTHFCDCYLAVEYPVDHPDYFDGIQNRAWWVKFYSESIIFKRVRGVAIVRSGVSGWA